MLLITQTSNPRGTESNEIQDKNDIAEPTKQKHGGGKISGDSKCSSRVEQDQGASGHSDKGSSTPRIEGLRLGGKGKVVRDTLGIRHKSARGAGTQEQATLSGRY